MGFDVAHVDVHLFKSVLVENLPILRVIEIKELKVLVESASDGCQEFLSYGGLHHGFIDRFLAQ